MSPQFEAAIGGMADIPQWFVWRLVWNAEEGKYTKVPCAHDGSQWAIDGGDPENWSDFDTVRDVVAKLNARVAGGALLRYALGFWLTKESGYWFLDIDKCLDAEGKLLPFADHMVRTFPGAFVEWSSSKRGLHLIGQGVAPERHRNKPEKDMVAKLKPLELEFYTNERGIAFGLDGMAAGSADVAFDVLPLCNVYFPQRPVVESGRRAEWRGPDDDDVLLERALSARKSAAVTFGNKLGFDQLFRGDCEKNNENDAALASHLAFWTGCDEERIERLMRRSGLVREKWDSRRRSSTYIGYTITRMCEQCDNVYREPERNTTVQSELYPAASAPALSGMEQALASQSNGTVTTIMVASERISPEVFERVSALLDTVAACGDELTLHNEVIPLIQQGGVPGALQERLVQAVKNKLAFWDNKMGVAKIRALLFPPAARNTEVSDGSALPEWAKTYCFVANGDRFYNTNNAQYITMVGFQAIYGRFMPITDQGRRENAAEKCLHFWGMPVVEQVGYRPDQGAYFEWDGVSYANSYSPSSVPTAASEFTPEGIRGIGQFQRLLYDMCGRRDDVYLNLLYWYAHNVQFPGKKIRWAPIIKGVHGDGKTLAIAVLRSAMGYRNLNSTSNSNVSNSGGFTDWAVRGAVNVIEEIMLTGKPRHQLYNAMKEFISNDICDVNPKGGKPYQTFNTTNHCANTNHNDALPMEPTDRRWFVVFTPWSSLEDMMRYCGLDGLGWKARTDAIDYAKNHCAGELRAWFLSVQIPSSFDINGSAMMTPEKRRMMATSKDDAESAALAIINAGAQGITDNVISSSHLSRLLHIRSQLDGFELPRGIALNHMLTRMGYSKLEKQVKWNGQTHTIWLRDGVELTNDDVRIALENSNPTQTSNSNLLTA